MKNKKWKLLIILSLLTTTVFAQNPYKEVAGNYHLSKMEFASNLYLLEDKTFLYFAVFGNVDLECWGNYEIKNDQIRLHPDTNLMDEFEFYGTSNPSDSLQIYFLKPYNQKFTIKVESKVLPPFPKGKKFVSVMLPKTRQLTITYHSLESPKEEKIRIKLPKNTDEVRILHNEYASMIRQLTKNTLNTQNGEYAKENKKEITPELVEKIKLRINRKRNFTSFEKDGKQYNKLLISEQEN